MAKMVDTSYELCLSCVHNYGKAGALIPFNGLSQTTLIACKYILDTGERRNCPVGKCDKYKAKKKRKRNGIKNTK